MFLRASERLLVSWAEPHAGHLLRKDEKVLRAGQFFGRDDYGRDHTSD